MTTATERHYIHPRYSYRLLSRLRFANGTAESWFEALLMAHDSFFAAPLQPSELFDISMRGAALDHYVNAEISQAADAAKEEIRDIRGQRRIDHLCRGFAREILAYEPPRRLDEAGLARLAELTVLAGEGHSTIRWIREELLSDE